MKKIVSIITPCFNERQNVEELILRIRAVMENHQQYDYEHIFIDNNSDDGTPDEIKKFTSSDPRIRLIVNSRNFGPIRSPAHSLYQTSGNAVVMMAADLQDPPELISEFLKKWEAGFKIVIGVKPKSKESKLMFLVRKLYYYVLGKISESPHIENFTGFGLYDEDVINIFRTLNSPYPYFRGFIAELGFSRAEIPFEQPKRKNGVSKFNFYILYDVAMLGITSHSKVPLRLATMCGFIFSIINLFVAMGYGIAKLLFWESFSLGIAPLIVGVFFFGSIQLFFIGLIGEYIGSIHTQVVRRPLVIERERVNFPES